MMNTFKLYILAALTLLAGSLRAQNKEVMAQMQGELQQLFERVYTAPTDNERYLANEQAVQLFQEALQQDNSFYWKWDFGTRVSVLTASTRQFRIITWPVVRDNGEYECFGFVQSWNERTGVFDLWTLTDQSDEMPSPEESVCFPESWYGCVYQQLVETKQDGKVSYMLLGWSGVDALRQKKVMEPIFFRPGQSKPQFGNGVFRKEKNRRRLVLQYSSRAAVNLRYDEQYCQVVENRKKKDKKTGRTVNEQVVRHEKLKMVLFDQVEPQLSSFVGLYQYYYPSGTEMAYIFVGGKWELHDGAQGRLADPKLNKEFAPLPKSTPRYQVNYNPSEE